MVSCSDPPNQIGDRRDTAPSSNGLGRWAQDVDCEAHAGLVCLSAKTLGWLWSHAPIRQIRSETGETRHPLRMVLVDGRRMSIVRRMRVLSVYRRKLSVGYGLMIRSAKSDRRQARHGTLFEWSWSMGAGCRL